MPVSISFVLPQVVAFTPFINLNCTDMKKLLFAFLLLCSTTATCLAQNSTDKFSLGLETGLPLGNFHKYSSSILGVSAKYEHSIGEGLFITGTAGFSNVHNKDFYYSGSLIAKSSNSGVVPLKAGLKYFLSTNLYMEGQAGASFYTRLGGSPAFTYSPGIGYNFSNHVDLGLRYEAWTKEGSTSGHLGLRLGYSF
jgi:hypothetical protein